MNPSFTSILVSVTEGCHVGCAHCGFIGSTRDRETEISDLTDWVGQACTYGIPMIIFTGGEPFEKYEVLRKGVLAAFNHGAMSALFTLEIPDITLCITYASEQDRLGVRENYLRYKDRVRFYESRVIPTPFIRQEMHQQDHMLDGSAESYEPTCWLETPIINPNGDLFTCHAGKVGAHGNMEDLPYWLGNLRRNSFAEIMAKARQKVEYQYLRTHGPRGVAQLFKEYPELSSALKKNKFTGPCDMCFAVLSTPKGQSCLSDYAHKPEVVNRINIKLALNFGEPPLDFRIG